MTLRFRVILFTICILVPAIGAGAWMVAATYQRERSAYDATMRETARALSLVVDRELQRRDAIVRTLAASDSLQSWDLAAFDRQARSATQGQIDGFVVLLDDQQQYVNTSLPNFPGPMLQPMPVPLVRDRPGLTDLYVGRTSGMLQLSYVVPVTVRDKLYNVSLVILPGELQKIITQQNLPPGWLAGIVTRSGHIVARQPDPERWLGQVAPAEFRRQVKAQAEGFYDAVSLDGREVLNFYSTSAQFGTTFSIAVPRSLLNARMYRSAAEVAAGALLLLLAGCAAAWWVARRLVRPMEMLQAAARDLEEGHGVMPPHTGITEFDQVGVALLRASERIRASSAAMEERIAHAVADVRDTQARLAQSQKLEAIGRLTGGVAHDFNNLLQTLSTGLHVLDRLVQEPRARPLIEAGLRAVHRAARLVQQMLAFGQRQPLKPQAIDFRNQLLAMETLLSKALPATVAMHTDLASDLWNIEADPGQLELALLNVVFNARDAMAGSGAIVIRARNGGTAPHQQQGEPREFVSIEVSDTGAGIAPDLLPQVFEPFFTTKPVGQGTGLGLSQVFAFANESGGSVALHSVLNEGTTVTLSLPRAQGEVATEEPAALAAVLTGRCELLFVEDDVMVAEVVVSALRGVGFDVLLARTGDEAYALLQSGARVDAIFTDVIMPGDINGMELAQLVSRQWPDIPLVLASGYSDQVALQEFTILAKPYSIDAVVRALLEALQRRRRT
jgi:signal transduction histidine kinase/CheY-like chemotaxis protein